jgi:UDP-N-acetylmuramoyl-tripeptide--D-alanyl-D-alanine ligase
MLELGADEAAWHQRLADLAGGLGLDRIFLVGPRMSAATCAGAHRSAEPADAVEPLRDWLAEGPAVVLFKGSRGARVERVLQMLLGSASGGDH